MSRKTAIAYALGERASQRTSARPKTEPEPMAELTKREGEVAELIARGLTNKEIADTLVIAQRTAECHVENILTKLGLTTRTRVAAWLTSHQ